MEEYFEGCFILAHVLNIHFRSLHPCTQSKCVCVCVCVCVLIFKYNSKCPVSSTEITTIASFLPQEPIKRKDPLPPLGLKPAEVNKAPLPKGKTPVLPDISKAQQRAPRRAGDLVSVPAELVR